MVAEHSMVKTKVSHLFQLVYSAENQTLSGFLLIVLCIFLLGYGNRLRMQQLQQTDWTNQQIREKELYKEQERARDDAFYQ